jgi:tocopherol cyclase
MPKMKEIFNPSRLIFVFAFIATLEYSVSFRLLRHTGGRTEFCMPAQGITQSILRLERSTKELFFSQLAALSKPQDLDDAKGMAYSQQTPHSERHFLPSHPSSAYRLKWYRRLIPRPLRKSSKRLRTSQRFMEGWYYRLTLPEENASFAFIFSIEDPGRRRRPKGSKDLRCCGAQIMGPNDEYLVQTSTDDTKFWAWENSQGLGCTFDYHPESTCNATTAALAPDSWREHVVSGFQMLPTSLQGRIEGHDGSLGGVGPGQGVPGDCTFDMTIAPRSGWGDTGGTQKSTAGWLARYPVFEPHWQVTLSDATATGSVTWKNKTFTFENQPLYAEKNWGGSFPIKWYWFQCNAFENYDDLTVTAGGGIRKLPLLGKTEELGMVSIHYKGVFYEAVPWAGDMSWEVDPWGKWILRGRCTSGDRLFETEVVAICDPKTKPGVVLRAPTEQDGLAYFCKDSFLADATLSVWHLEWDAASKAFVRSASPPIIDRAHSLHGGVEVGGGPWWDVWKGVSDMKQPMKGIVSIPYKLDSLRKRLR